MNQRPRNINLLAAAGPFEQRSLELLGSHGSRLKDVENGTATASKIDDGTGRGVSVRFNADTLELVVTTRDGIKREFKSDARGVGTMAMPATPNGASSVNIAHGLPFTPTWFSMTGINNGSVFYSCITLGALTVTSTHVEWAAQFVNGANAGAGAPFQFAWACA